MKKYYYIKKKIEFNNYLINKIYETYKKLLLN